MMSSPGKSTKIADEEALSPTKGEDPDGKKSKRKAQKLKKKAKVQALLAAAAMNMSHLVKTLLLVN